MSVTRIICSGCGFPHVYCSCEVDRLAGEALRKAREGRDTAPIPDHALVPLSLITDAHHWIACVTENGFAKPRPSDYTLIERLGAYLKTEEK